MRIPGVTFRRPRNLGAHGVILAVVCLSNVAFSESPSNESTSDTKRPTPALISQAPADGPALEFDFPSLEIGIAEYNEGPTGATVFYFPGGAFAAVDVRGGAPGTLLTDTLRNGYHLDDTPWVDAICFAGGSCYGLEAASGVAAELLERRGRSNAWQDIAVVPAAIVFDFNNRDNAIYPDKALGRVALKNARTGRFPLGARGAGRFVHVGGFLGPQFRERSGQGGSFRQIGDTRLAVFTVVNALGTVVDRQGVVVRGNRDPETGERAPINVAATSAKQPSSDGTGKVQPPTQNTTLTLVVTNQRLAYPALHRLAVQAHASMNRAIHPFNTARDGDTLFAVTTSEVDDADVDFQQLSLHAAELVWDAVLTAVSSDK
jgi:L-aminopeptidase/D-esterase-like protein